MEDPLEERSERVVARAMGQGIAVLHEGLVERRPIGRG
jgi:hypothetical protein